jgi:hypothetical protein
MPSILGQEFGMTDFLTAYITLLFNERFYILSKKLLSELGLLGLRTQRMPSKPGQEFSLTILEP